MILKRILVAMIGVLAVGGTIAPLLAAEKVPDKPVAQVAPPKSSPDVAALPEGQNVEKLLYTLNETLQENRKIRQSMRDLQDAFEKVTIEKSDLAVQVRKVEQLAIQRNRDAGQKIDDLRGQLDNSKKEMEKLQAAGQASAEQKSELEKKLQVLDAEKEKMQGLLNTAILEPERDQLVEQMKKNDEAVKNAVKQISSMDGENIALKEQLIQSYFDLGNMFYDLGRYQDAAVQYLNVLEWNPNHAWAHHNLAIIYDYHLHKVKLAILHYQKYLHLKQPSEEAREARLRLWDLEQLTKVSPEQPLKQDFDKYESMPRS